MLQNALGPMLFKHFGLGQAQAGLSGSAQENKSSDEKNVSGPDPGKRTKNASGAASGHPEKRTKTITICFSQACP